MEGMCTSYAAKLQGGTENALDAAMSDVRQTPAALAQVACPTLNYARAHALSDASTANGAGACSAGADSALLAQRDAARATTTGLKCGAQSVHGRRGHALHAVHHARICGALEAYHAAVSLTHAAVLRKRVTCERELRTNQSQIEPEIPAHNYLLAHARTHTRTHSRTHRAQIHTTTALYRRLLQLADLRAEGLQSKNNARAGVRFGTHQTHSQSRQRHLHKYVPPSAPPLSPQLSPQPSYSRLPAPARAHARARATLPPRPRARGLRRARSGLHHQRPRVIAGHVGEQRMKARRVKQYQTRKHTQACRAAHYL
jgi:hypothetical protein